MANQQISAVLKQGICTFCAHVAVACLAFAVVDDTFIEKKQVTKSNLSSGFLIYSFVFPYGTASGRWSHNNIELISCLTHNVSYMLCVSLTLCVLLKALDYKKAIIRQQKN